jgi:DNA-binding HxlR family transcriptional regulator
MLDILPMKHCMLNAMPLTVLVDREAKKEVGECPVDVMMRVMDGRWKGTILWRLVDGRIR